MPFVLCCGVRGIFSAIPAAEAVAKSTIHCKFASTTDPEGNAPLFGVRLTARGCVIGLPRNIEDCPAETSTTVHASGKASATAGCSHDEVRVGTVGKIGAGLGAFPAGVGAASCCAKFVGVSCEQIPAARCGVYKAAIVRHGALSSSGSGGGFPACHTAFQYAC